MWNKDAEITLEKAELLKAHFEGLGTAEVNELRKKIDELMAQIAALQEKSIKDNDEANSRLTFVLIRCWTTSCHLKLDKILTVVPAIIIWWHLWWRRNNLRNRKTVSYNSLVFNVNTDIWRMSRLIWPKFSTLARNGEFF
ncbi:hypothetical protein H5410_031658 [Solanum commersonii]|uniref:Uncharacterized protein n=1 Tax=Solanum commersonii TaxID=4109 RepID=A0A9J5YKS1_SOLCO|nr:hypothetical protein H5410_031658 [Solanum commersonii]